MITYLLLLGLITINGLLVQRHFGRLEDRIEWLENHWTELSEVPAIQARAVCGCGHDKAFHDKEGQCHWSGPESVGMDYTSLLIKPTKKDYPYTEDYQEAVDSYHRHLKEWASKAPDKNQIGPCGCQGYNGPDVEYLPQVVG